MRFVLNQGFTELELVGHIEGSHVTLTDPRDGFVVFSGPLDRGLEMLARIGFEQRYAVVVESFDRHDNRYLEVECTRDHRVSPRLTVSEVADNLAVDYAKGFIGDDTTDWRVLVWSSQVAHDTRRPPVAVATGTGREPALPF